MKWEDQSDKIQMTLTYDEAEILYCILSCDGCDTKKEEVLKDKLIDALDEYINT